MGLFSCGRVLVLESHGLEEIEFASNIQLDDVAP